jgi:D-alanyl-D-alanine-carboxypeptidase/D-alanyl-D-alanine-endopeptidase
MRFFAYPIKINPIFPLTAFRMDTRLLKKFSLSLLAIAFASMPVLSQAQTQKLASQVVDEHAEHIFYSSGAMGMALVVVDKNQQVFRSFGETRAGSGQRPREDSLIRIASLTKLMTSEVLVKLAEQGTVKVTDPLRKYAPGNAFVPYYSPTSPMTLLNLATHTAGLPREQPGGAPHRPVFTWPNRAERWSWLQTAKLTVPPGSHASYSNLGFDLLSDALADAAHQPYPQLFRQLITQPNGMVDTTFTPTAAQCSRLMEGLRPSPCLNTIAAQGSGGVYSTPADMGRWMKQFLPNAAGQQSPTAALAQKMYFRRTDLVSLKGMDVPGQAYELGMGWITMAPTPLLPRIIQKTGGGGGFITYMAMVPQRGVGVFIVVTRSELTKFKNMSDGVNDLVADLVRNNEI